MSGKEYTYTTRVNEGTFQRIQCVACTRRFRPNIVRVDLMAGDEVLGSICPQCLEGGPAAMVSKLHLQQEHLSSLERALELCTDWVTPGELAAAEKKIDERFIEDEKEMRDAPGPLVEGVVVAGDFEDISF